MQQEALALPANPDLTTPVLSNRRIAAAQVFGTIGAALLTEFSFNALRDSIYDFIKFVTGLLDQLGVVGDSYLYSGFFDIALIFAPILAVFQLLIIKNWVRWPKRWVLFTWLTLPVLLPLAVVLVSFILENVGPYLDYIQMRNSMRGVDVRFVLEVFGVGFFTSLLSSASCGALLGLVQSTCMRGGKMRWIAAAGITWMIPFFLLLVPLLMILPID